jgi:hypothetical protein
MTPNTPHQGRGELHLKSFHLTMTNCEYIKKKIASPFFYQLKFKADWLTDNPCSHEKRFVDFSDASMKTWKAH